MLGAISLPDHVLFFSCFLSVFSPTPQSFSSPSCYHWLYFCYWNEMGWPSYSTTRKLFLQVLIFNSLIASILKPVPGIRPAVVFFGGGRSRFVEKWPEIRVRCLFLYSQVQVLKGVNFLGQNGGTTLPRNISTVWSKNWCGKGDYFMGQSGTWGDKLLVVWPVLSPKRDGSTTGVSPLGTTVPTLKF